MSIEDIPLTGKLSPNEDLEKAEKLHEGFLQGPESLAWRGDELYTGIQTGLIVKIKDRMIHNVTRMGNTCDGDWDTRCGRPLGMRFIKDGSLIVADAYLGIFRINVDTGEKTRLVSVEEEHAGKKPHFLDDVAIASDGNIFFTDASSISTLDTLVFEVASSGSGRVLKYDPNTKKVEAVVEELHFPNGVELSPDESHLLIAESVRRRILCYHLKGPKRGKMDVFATLPGSPDNIRSNGRGGYYIGIAMMPHPNKASPDIIDILSSYPKSRRFIARILYLIHLPFSYGNILFPNPILGTIATTVANLAVLEKMNPAPYGLALELDRDGNVVRSFHSPSGDLHSISEIQEWHGYLYIASFTHPFLARVKL